MEKLRKTMSIEDEEEVVEEIINLLKKKQCTISNFEEISKKVHSFYDDNAVLKD